MDRSITTTTTTTIILERNLPIAMFVNNIDSGKRNKKKHIYIYTYVHWQSYTSEKEIADVNERNKKGRSKKERKSTSLKHTSRSLSCTHS